MKIIHTVNELHEELSSASYKSLVPTMGNLHEGHLRLVQAARQASHAKGGITVATIFVNRLQFGPNEDFDRYPRTLEKDCELLEKNGCDVVFAPDEHALYPETQRFKVSPPEELANILEGHFRPGFFTGVCTVVMKLFSMIQPQSAFFGKKDYQQLMVIQQMARQFNLPISVIGLETERAQDGLALSSRNGYLSAPQRLKAVELYRALQNVAAQCKGSDADPIALCQNAHQRLTQEGWEVDYISLCHPSNLSPCEKIDGSDLVVLAAAKIGKTRLIDNLEIKF
jgi:pantoate--beta-alanine ligase